MIIGIFQNQKFSGYACPIFHIFHPLKEKWMNAPRNDFEDERVDISLEQFNWHTFSYEKYSAMGDEEANRIYSLQVTFAHETDCWVHILLNIKTR